MPRIRTIKPEFWQDTKLSRMPVLDRLVFLCLISMSDDQGRIEGDSETVQRFGFPREDSRGLQKALERLQEAGRIAIYDSGGNPHVAVLNFSKHQRVDHPTGSRLPAPPKPGAHKTSREDSRGLAPDQGSGIRDQGMDQGSSSSPEGDGFEPFWNSYPRKIGKGAALGLWKKLRPSKALQATILSAVEAQKKSPQWVKDGGQFVPNPATWLRQGRWEDDAAVAVGWERGPSQTEAIRSARMDWDVKRRRFESEFFKAQRRAPTEQEITGKLGCRP